MSSASSAEQEACGLDEALPLVTSTFLANLSIGHASNTLSGGAAQRLKLACQLTAGMAHEPTVYVLDEPTTGLHLSDVERLVKALRSSVLPPGRASGVRARARPPGVSTAWGLELSRHRQMERPAKKRGVIPV
jgi:hypothetical protein